MIGRHQDQRASWLLHLIYLCANHITWKLYYRSGITSGGYIGGEKIWNASPVASSNYKAGNLSVIPSREADNPVIWEFIYSLGSFAAQTYSVGDSAISTMTKSSATNSKHDSVSENNVQ